jgi:4-hydroxy-3-polyprenylbenzoate decarboxylase
MEDCLLDLERHGQLIRVKEEVDPYLEMAAIHLRVHEAGGPALLFENVKGSSFRAASNIFGTLERSKFIFRDTFSLVQQLIRLKSDPASALKQPFKHGKALLAGLHALPKKVSNHRFNKTSIADLPLIQHWPMDGGAFVTLPQVYTEDIEQPGIMKANLGMYRIQLTGNEYQLNKEIGLHYQLHRGIGVHQTKANSAGKPLRVSCFVGGPPSHTLSAVMPLPEGLSEMTFAGVLGGRRFRYLYDEGGFALSTDADFVITGEVFPNENKPEGPFGDHLGYYSLTHPFPLMKVRGVYAKPNAIWPFTVVGRPPQEDTRFGELIHEMTGYAVQQEIPGLKEVHAVDAAGVHPLLLAVGSERYTPYLQNKRPAEILTIANHILGTGQLSLAKFLFITAAFDKRNIHTHDVREFLTYIFERIDLSRDLHFYTQTTIDTLDYSGNDLNAGSKLVLACYGEKKRELCTEVPDIMNALSGFENPQICLPGVIALQTKRFTTYEDASKEIEQLHKQLTGKNNNGVAQIIICDDSSFVAKTLSNYLWVSYTRCNPSHDIYGIDSFTEYKHWGCRGALIFDARIKPHHAPAVEKDPATEKKIDRLFDKGGSLYQAIK